MTSTLRVNDFEVHGAQTKAKQENGLPQFHDKYVSVSYRDKFLSAKILLLNHIGKKDKFLDLDAGNT